MDALFLGSIGVIAETSELQRRAYNAAFEAQGLDWYWNVANYCEMLKIPGGVKRISSFSPHTLSREMAENIHQQKQAFYAEYLTGGIKPRRGVAETINLCKSHGIRLGLITTTTEENINILADALSAHINFADFELITTKQDVSLEKPDSAVYRFALQQFGLSAEQVIAVEDTEANQEAALMEQIRCYLFAGEYAATTHHLNAIKNLYPLAKQICRSADASQEYKELALNLA